MELAVGLGGSRHATIRLTDRADGDLAVTQPVRELAARRAAVLAGPWVWLRQVHGGDVLVVEGSDVERVAGAEADAVVTTVIGPVLAVQTADCAPLALVADEGVVGAVHAGWRGLAAGVVQRAVDAVRGLGGREVSAYLGPCIGPECYEFGPDDLHPLAQRFGPDVIGETASGRPALDLRAAVRAALGEVDVRLAFATEVCTACDASYFSHRARGDEGRQALAIRLGSVAT